MMYGHACYLFYALGGYHRDWAIYIPLVMSHVTRIMSHMSHGQTWLTPSSSSSSPSYVSELLAWSDRESKWCGIAGRRPYIEDFASQGYVNIGMESDTALSSNNRDTRGKTAHASSGLSSRSLGLGNSLVCLATTVVDGHLGTVSARYVATYMLRHLAKAAAAVPIPHATSLNDSRLQSEAEGEGRPMNREQMKGRHGQASKHRSREEEEEADWWEETS
jgi:hypothetical protein